MELLDSSMAKRLGVTPDRLYGFCVSRILDAGVEGITYDARALELIESGDMLPNELAYLAVAGVHYLMLMTEAEDRILKEVKDGDN